MVLRPTTSAREASRAHPRRTSQAPAAGQGGGHRGHRHSGLHQMRQADAKAEQGARARPTAHEGPHPAQTTAAEVQAARTRPSPTTQAARSTCQTAVPSRTGRWPRW